LNTSVQLIEWGLTMAGIETSHPCSRATGR
jgi:hypothetical protein